MLGSVCSIATVLVSVITTQEIPPSPEELAALRAKKGGFGAAIARDLGGDRRDAGRAAQARAGLPVPVVRDGLLLAVRVAVDRPVGVRGRVAGRPGVRATRSSWTGLVNGWYNIVTFLVAFPLVALAKKRGAKLVHISCLLCAAVGLLIFAQLTNKYLMFLPIIGLGIAWASIMGVPYIMAVRMIPSSRYGVYMGIINMMIVIPMLIQTVTFGAIYSSVLGDNPSNAIRFAGILLAVAAAAMLWIKEPPIVRDVDDVLEMPMGGGH